MDIGNGHENIWSSLWHRITSHIGFLVNCCWLTVCIVVVVLCVLLSYVYLLYCVNIDFFYFRCRTAG